MIKTGGNIDPTLYSPDVNVRKGYIPGKCSKPTSAGGWYPTPSTQELPLPDDTNVTAPYPTATIGKGDWQVSFNNYWNANFPGVAKPSPVPATRYDLYNYEIAKNLATTQSVGKEVGTPACAPLADAQAGRRIIYAAVVDCSKFSGGVNNNVPVSAIVRLFLLQPTIQVSGGFGTMLAEYVDVALSNQKASPLHDIVQLYR